MLMLNKRAKMLVYFLLKLSAKSKQLIFKLVNDIPCKWNCIQ